MRTRGKLSKAAKSVHVYILDACQRANGGNGPRLNSMHYQKQDIMRDLFEKHFECEVNPVIFPSQTKPEAVLEYFEEELADKGEDDLVIVYYHGSAGWNGEEYSFKFAGHPKKDIDAYELIQFFVDSEIDVMLLLDCWIPERFARKWKPSDEEGGCNNVEIIARGEPMQRSDGQIVEDDEGDFTWNLANDLTDFIKNIDVPKKKGGFRNRKSPLSISTILKNNEKMCSNPRRLWLKRTKAGDDRPVARFVMWPADIRKHGKARWFTKQIQGQMTRVKEAPDAKHDEAKEEDSLFVEEAESESDLDDDDEGYDETMLPEGTEDECGKPGIDHTSKPPSPPDELV